MRWGKFLSLICTQNNRKFCYEEAEEDDGGKLALAAVGGAFLLLGVGVALSVLFAIIEFLWNVRNVSVEDHVSTNIIL